MSALLRQQQHEQRLQQQHELEQQRKWALEQQRASDNAAAIEQVRI
jgi:hypothetical protein